MPTKTEGEIRLPDYSGLDELLESKQVYRAVDAAEILDLTPGRVRRLAVHRGFGKKYGPKGSQYWLYSADEVESMKTRGPFRGRPRVKA